VSRVSSLGRATKALPLETRRGPQVVPMRNEIIKNKNVGPLRSPTLAPLVGVGPTLKPQHPGAGVQARWGLMHLMLQWVSHHEHPANPRPVGREGTG
jgi:hypothetical protein